jgi:glycosyltransferase involved in cell wall biosynthesis
VKYDSPFGESNMKVCIVVDNISDPSSGEARPFVNWAKISHDFKLVLYRSPFRIEMENCITTNDFDSLVEIAKNFDYVLTDDWHVWLGEKISRQSGVKLAIYAQILYGLHSLGISASTYAPIRERIILAGTRYVPFTILSSRYRRAMRRATKVIANSFSTKILLKYLYSVESFGVVYPPVDTSVFKPMITKSRQMVLYLGSNVGDSDTRLITVACSEALSKEISIHAFGNRNALPKDLSNSVVYHFKMSDPELARLYSGSTVVVAPQRNETFGYVPIEALACGTRVLVGYFHELLMKDDNQKLIQQIGAEDIPNALDAIFKQPMGEEFQRKCVETVKRYSSERSASDLLRLLQK